MLRSAHYCHIGIASTPSAIRYWVFDVRRFSTKLIKIESAGAKPNNRVCLPLAITGASCAAETLAGGASHDPDDNCRHAALHRSGVGDRNFFRIHPALSAEDLAIDRYGVGLSLQQDCSCDCRHPARRRDLGNARDLSCRISIGLLELAAAASAACSFSPVWTARLRALACIFTRRLAHILAGVCWLHVPRGSFRDHYLFCDAVTVESRANATEYRMSPARPKSCSRARLSEWRRPVLASSAPTHARH